MTLTTLTLAILTALAPGAAPVATAAVPAGAEPADGLRVEATRVIPAAGTSVSLLRPNARGEVPVNASTPLDTRLFVVRGTHVSRLQSTGGASVRDIDDHGVAVGVQIRQNPDGTLRGVPLRWRRTAPQALPQPADRSLAATAINDRGDILLGSVAGLDVGPPLLRSARGGLTPVEVPGGTALVPTSLSESARPLTDDGRVLALTAETFPVVTFHSYVWQDGAVLADVGAGTLATHVTESGFVAGNLYEADGTVPFLWRDGVLRRLGGLGGGAAGMSDVNESGDVVGFADRADGARRGVLWQADGRLRELATLGGVDSVAVALDARGRVAGRADDAQGRSHPVLWIDGRAVDLGLPPGATGGVALQIAPDGSVYGTVTRPDGADVTVDVYRWRLTGG